MMAGQWRTLLALLLLLNGRTIFAFTSSSSNVQSHTKLGASNTPAEWPKFVASAILFSTLTLSSPLTCWADELGVETEAPTLFTGESVMICKKRGPLGACLETVERTRENDNDKATKYFKEPVLKTRLPDKAQQESEDSSDLIQRLKQQTEDNREKNNLLVQQRSALNDQSASFGPFDRQVVILNTDGRTFTLLENPQAMRLKNAGFIEDRRFVRQPTQEELADAMDSSQDGGGLIGGLMRGIFGGGNGE